MRAIKLATVLTLMLILAGLFAPAAETPKVGASAPDFTLNSAEGKPISLHDFKGKWVVLYFYPKDMTPGCSIEAHNFQRDLAKYDKVNAVVLGVSMDNEKKHQEFCTKEGLTFKLLADTDKKVSKAYNSTTLMGLISARNTFLISPDGKIAKVYLGVSPSSHSDQVLADLAALQSAIPI